MYKEKLGNYIVFIFYYALCYEFPEWSINQVYDYRMNQIGVLGSKFEHAMKMETIELKKKRIAFTKKYLWFTFPLLLFLLLLLLFGEDCVKLLSLRLMYHWPGS